MTIADIEGLTTTSSVTVIVNQTVTTLGIAPPQISLHLNAQSQFSATGEDQFGNPMATMPALNWSVASGGGSINSAGLYTAPSSPGIATISVSGGSASQVADVTIFNAPPSVAVAAAASPTMVDGTTTNLSVLGADDGGQANLTYTWTTEGNPPAPVLFSRNSTNAAQSVMATFSAPGTYQFLVTIVDAEGASTISSVTVQVIPTYSGIDVSPSGSALQHTQSEQFSAVAVNQFGNPMATQPIFTWSTLANVGTISAAGLYTAPNAGAGNATIIATAGNISGSASASLLDDLAVSVPPSQSTAPTLPLVFSTADPIFVTDTDAATQSVPLTLTLSGTGGVISLSELNGLSLSAGTGTNDITVSVTGTLAAINASLQGLKFTPDPGFAGDATLAVTINEISVSASSPMRSVNIYVQEAATTSTSTTSSIFSPGASSDSENSILTGILDGPLTTTGDSTPTTSQTTSTDSTSVISQDAITASDTIFPDPTPSPDAPSPEAVAPPAAPAESAAKPAPTVAAVASVVTAPKPSAPANSASANPFATASSIPDEQVRTVPDQVFTFLDPQSPMLKNLDEMKTDMASEKALKVTAGSASVVSFSASAAYLIWMLRGGSLLSSLLSVFPAWKSMDPIPVLDSFENHAKSANPRPATMIPSNPSSRILTRPLKTLALSNTPTPMTWNQRHEPNTCTH